MKQMWEWFRDSGIGEALLFIAASLLLAWIADRFIRRVLARLTKRTSNQLDDTLFAQFYRPLQATVVSLGLIFGLERIKLDEVWLDRADLLLQSILIVIWSLAVIKAFSAFLKMTKSRHKHDSVMISSLPLLHNLLTVLVLVGCGIWILDLWEINITPLVASAGIVTAAVALASKDTLANFFGGLSVIIDRPYRLGDYVVLDTGERGEVTHIGIRSTRIITRDDVQITVPNAIMANLKIINQTAPKSKFRVHCKVGVSYDSDPDQVEQVMLFAIKGISEILLSPTPRVRFRSFGDSALMFELLAWVAAPADRGRVQHQMNKAVFYAFKDAGIEIPFTQIVLHTSHESQDEGD